MASFANGASTCITQTASANLGQTILRGKKVHVMAFYSVRKSVPTVLGAPSLKSLAKYDDGF